MSSRLQVLLICLWLLVLFRIIIQMKKRIIDVKNALVWLVLDIALLVFSVFPSIFYSLSSLIGIEVPTNMLFFLGFILVLMIEYNQTIIISKLHSDQRKLIQNIGIRDYEVSHMKNEDNKD